MRLLATAVVLALAAGGTAASAATAPAAAPLLPVEASCNAPAGDPAPGTPEWIARDTANQYCAALRIRDQLASPAFGFGNLTQGATLYVDQTIDQALPTRATRAAASRP